jgi:hypothetical protein
MNETASRGSSIDYRGRSRIAEFWGFCGQQGLIVAGIGKVSLALGAFKQFIDLNESVKICWLMHFGSYFCSLTDSL